MALAVLSNSWQSGQPDVSHHFTHVSEWTKLFLHGNVILLFLVTCSHLHLWVFSVKELKTKFVNF